MTKEPILIDTPTKLENFKQKVLEIFVRNFPKTMKANKQKISLFMELEECINLEKVENKKRLFSVESFVFSTYGKWKVIEEEEGFHDMRFEDCTDFDEKETELRFFLSKYVFENSLIGIKMEEKNYFELRIDHYWDYNVYQLGKRLEDKAAGYSIRTYMESPGVLVLDLEKDELKLSLKGLIKAQKILIHKSNVDEKISFIARKELKKVLQKIAIGKLFG